MGYSVERLYSGLNINRYTNGYTTFWMVDGEEFKTAEEAIKAYLKECEDEVRAAFIRAGDLKPTARITGGK